MEATTLLPTTVNFQVQMGAMYNRNYSTWYNQRHLSIKRYQEMTIVCKTLQILYRKRFISLGKQVKESFQKFEGQIPRIYNLQARRKETQILSHNMQMTKQWLNLSLCKCCQNRILCYVNFVKQLRNEKGLSKTLLNLRIVIKGCISPINSFWRSVSTC